MKIRSCGLVLLVMLAAFACRQSTNNKSSSYKKEQIGEYEPKYANRFKIEYYKDHKRILIKHPWDSVATPLITLLSEDSLFLQNNPEAVKIPVKKWVSVASTQISYANKLGVLNQLVGMAEPQYVTNEQVQAGLKNGKVKNIGTAFAPDVEMLIALNPDMMMISPFKDDFYSSVRSAGIKLTTNSSYLENTPMGRVEWLVYVATFFNKETEAIEEVGKIAKRYDKVKSIVSNITQKPSVFLGKLYQGVWYTAGADSYNANFLKDAGANYVFKDKRGTGSLAYDFETVYQAASKSDFWSLIVNYNGEYSYSVLRNEDARYSDFEAFAKRNIVVSNSKNSLIYEKGLLEPDIVLADLVKLFHPELKLSNELVYYNKLIHE